MLFCEVRPVDRALDAPAADGGTGIAYYVQLNSIAVELFPLTNAGWALIVGREYVVL